MANMYAGVTFKRQKTCGSELREIWCEPCLKAKRQKIDAVALCNECDTFYCTTCDAEHKETPTMKYHRMLRGLEMPKSFADKPFKYRRCTSHIDNFEELFCFKHSKVLCEECVRQYHKGCCVEQISTVCLDLGHEDVKQFKVAMNGILQSVNDTKLEAEEYSIEFQKHYNDMMNEAKKIRDNIISKAHAIFRKTSSKINEIYAEKNSELSEQISTLDYEMNMMQEFANDIDDRIIDTFQPEVFIQMHRLANKIQESQKQTDDATSQLKQTNIYVQTDKTVSTFLKKAKTMADVTEMAKEFKNVPDVPRIVFPVHASKVRQNVPGRRHVDVSDIRTTKIAPINSKVADDTQNCSVSGIEFTENGFLLISDRPNKRIKVFKPDYEFLSSITLSDYCSGVRITSPATAVVTTNDKYLHILDISDLASIAIRSSVSLEYRAFSFAPCNDRLAVIVCDEQQKSAKMIGMDGTELWTVSKGADGKAMFMQPLEVVIGTINDSASVVVSDWGRRFLVALDARNGVLLKTVDLSLGNPHGLAVDEHGNVFVCCRTTKELRLFTNDLCKSRVLLSRADIGLLDLLSVHYDRKLARLFIPNMLYRKEIEVLVFQLSV